MSVALGLRNEPHFLSLQAEHLGKSAWACNGGIPGRASRKLARQAMTREYAARAN